MIIEEPADAGSVREPTSPVAWTERVNFGDEWTTFRDLDLGKTDQKSGGSTGEDWVAGRFYVLYEGRYADRLDARHQLSRIERRLELGYHGSSTNALVAQVYREPDLKAAEKPRPRATGIVCLTQLQFRPHEEYLDLHAVFRSQWWDLKAYGNLLSLASLLAQTAARTDYEVGRLEVRCNNVVFEDSGRAERVSRELGGVASGLP
ncbi:hypothetical protein [Haloglomus salinum]|uniref:hypothetical protein n=1 Tax=Haloglomus salinum TaxID=2962673 RepID=UPI0020CA003D|nr:hypothetical protein [Haloglomus salinum]